MAAENTGGVSFLPFIIHFLQQAMGVKMVFRFSTPAYFLYSNIRFIRAVWKV
jgi:hypothetical protein